MQNVQPTVFNPAQLYLLGVFSRIKSNEELDDIKQLVSDYYASETRCHNGEDVAVGRAGSETSRRNQQYGSACLA